MTRRPQDSVEWIPRDHHGMRLNAPKFGHGLYLFSQHSFGLSFLHTDHFFWLIVIHNMDQMQLPAAGLRKKPSLTQGPIGAPHYERDQATLGIARRMPL
jgi:hypothetical protein